MKRILSKLVFDVLTSTNFWNLYIKYNKIYSLFLHIVYCSHFLARHEPYMWYDESNSCPSLTLPQKPPGNVSIEHTLHVDCSTHCSFGWLWQLSRPKEYKTFLYITKFSKFSLICMSGPWSILLQTMDGIKSEICSYKLGYLIPMIPVHLQRTKADFFRVLAHCIDQII